MAKSRFLKPGKQVKKDIGKTFLNSAVSGGGFLGAKIGTNFLAPKITNEKWRRVLGPAKYLLGTIGEAFCEQPQAAAFCRGIAVSGIDTSATDFIPVDMQVKMRLSGLGAANAADTAVDGGKGFDWDKAAKEVDAQIAAEAAAKASKEAEDNVAGLDNQNEEAEGFDYAANAM